MGRSRKPLWSVWATVGSNPTLSASSTIVPADIEAPSNAPGVLDESGVHRLQRPRLSFLGQGRGEETRSREGTGGAQLPWTSHEKGAPSPCPWLPSTSLPSTSLRVPVRVLERASPPEDRRAAAANSPRPIREAL